jgi:hypothetical protein
MQNLIPGVAWGKKMNSKQFDKMYQRMLQREKKKQSEIQKEADRKKDDDLIGCTFKPKINKTKRNKKKLGVSVPRMNSQDFDEMDEYGTKMNKSVGKKTKDKFLARLEEMKRKDQERKEKTRRKYEEQKKIDFENNYTFQPNKIKKKKKSISTRRSIQNSKLENETIGKEGNDSHFRQVSGNVVGKKILNLFI